MKLLRFFLISALLSVLLLGCVADQQTDSSTQTATGGISNSAENINLKDIDITAEGDQTAITLSLLSGSRKAGYPESTLVSLPEYQITQLTQPQRLMITLHNVSFWDYEEKSAWALSDFVQGVFREVPADNDSLIIYIQLSQPADFTVEEAEGNLIVRVKPGEQNNNTKYFCVSDSFYEHQEGTWPDSVDMTPVLCSDLENKLLISQPFDTQADAESFMQSANAALKDTLPDNSVYVIQLEPNTLPEYNGIDYATSEGRSVVMKDNVLAETPVLLQNGKYLAAGPEGKIAFSRRYKPEEPALEQDSYFLSEKLWILDTNWRIQSLDIPEFYEISKAAFSKDGKYIALLDVTIENRVLYVYNFETGVLINLGEEGFGNLTSDFAWSDTDDTLYAMTGYGTMQMMSCVLLPDGTTSMSAVEEEPGAEGNLAVSQGRLFFADNYSGYAGIIYEIGDTRSQITEGLDFKMSSDGKTMLVLEAAHTGDEQDLTSLKLYDMETGTTTYIAENADITDFCFSQNCSKVYYTNALIDNAIDGYGFGLFSYDIASGVGEEVALCSTGNFAASAKAGEIYLIQYIEDTENSFYATYTYDLSL